ncbi:type II toxin-antitoxin system RelE/ParE family toxin [Massilia sp. MB5]|uniref:type II toxin-antitoxin system RelE/ParE family toxin n=1 Tax=Massilia sp. MB5 TaxID=2919578 RepID=UPI001F0EBCC7|nr:type II toxin-antitoxin system RelE/ParE family toxin [Massilia sp. MB5]UMR28686.1 type II toxin-antitoxin system RelE/ParE family toxin [Massilia sp. MB5]
MRYKVRLTDTARADIAELVAYVRQSFGEQAAHTTFKQLQAKFKLLHANPDLGTPLPQLQTLMVTQYRSYVIAPHTRFIYEIEENEKTIFIHLVCGARQDFESVCFSRLARAK